MKTFFGPLLLSLCVALSLSGCYESQKFADVPPDLSVRQKRFAAVVKALDTLKTADQNRTTALLTHSDERVRRAAALHLADVATERAAAADALSRVLSSDKTARVRTAAARSLASLDSPAGNTALVNALCDPDYTVRLYSWKSALKRLDTMIPALADTLFPESPARRMKCPSDDGVSQTLHTVVRSRIEEVGGRIVPILVQSMDALDPQRQAVAIYILGHLGEKSADALPAIIEKTASSDSPTRLSALRAIGKIGDRHPEVMPTLIEASKSNDPKVQEAASEALSNIQNMDEKNPKDKRPNRAGAGSRRVVPRQPRP